MSEFLPSQKIPARRGCPFSPLLRVLCIQPGFIWTLALTALASFSRLPVCLGWVYFASLGHASDRIGKQFGGDFVAAIVNCSIGFVEIFSGHGTPGLSVRSTRSGRKQRGMGLATLKITWPDRRPAGGDGRSGRGREEAKVVKSLFICFTDQSLPPLRL
ncbi:unnamed protein product [Protopolystoma xenopodis]|uniref:Uncharacterized protein n=1 Tax=Protopolystoma xenopodis TaxID=117903 RepID=A0A448WX80_9PLAT|nr:unnamed protein product [Protopolystoma xenopodis]